MNGFLKFLASIGILIGAFMGFVGLFGRWCKEKTSKQYVTVHDLKDYDQNNN